MFFTKKSLKIMIICILMSLIFSFFPTLKANAAGPLGGFTFEYDVNSVNGEASFDIDSTDAALQNDIKGTFVNKGFSSLQAIIFGVFGVSTLTMVVLFIINFTKLGAAAGNPQERSQVMRGLLYLGIAAALLGGVTMVVGFSTNLLK